MYRKMNESLQTIIMKKTNVEASELLCLFSYKRLNCY